MGLWEKKKTTKQKPYKTGAKSGVVKEPEVGYGGLFDSVEEGEKRKKKDTNN